MKEQIKQSVKILAPIGTLGGFISDVLTPLGPVTKWLFLCCLAITFILLIIYLLNKRKLFQNYLSSSAILTLVFGVFFLLNNNTEKGILGDNTESIAILQNSLFNIQETVDRVEDKVDVIDEKIDIRFDKIESLLKESNPIKNPKNANDFIINAYLYKNTGNLLKSEQAFKQFLKLTEIDKYDLFIDYFEVLKTNYGRTKALDVLRSSSNSKFIEVIEIFETNSGYKIYQMVDKIEGLPKSFKDWLLIYTSNETIFAMDSPFRQRETQDYAFIFDLYDRDLSLGKENEMVHQYFFNKGKAISLITDVQGGKPIYFNLLSSLQLNVQTLKNQHQYEIEKAIQRANERNNPRKIEFLKSVYGKDFDHENYDIDDITRQKIKESYKYYFQTCTNCPDTSLFIEMHYNPPTLY